MFISSFLLPLFFFSVLYEKRSIISCAGWLNYRILKEQNSCMTQLVRCGFKFGQCTTNATLAQLHISGTSQRVTARTQARLLAMVLVSQCDSVSESPATTRWFFFWKPKSVKELLRKSFFAVELLLGAFLKENSAKVEQSRHRWSRACEAPRLYNGS